MWIICQEEINSDIINRTCTFRAYKSVTPSRIEIIEINRPRTLPNATEIGTRCGWRTERTRLFLGTIFIIYRLSWSTSQYTNHTSPVPYKVVVVYISSLLSRRSASELSLVRSRSVKRATAYLRTERPGDVRPGPRRTMKPSLYKHSLSADNAGNIGNGYSFILRIDLVSHQSIAASS